MKFIKSIINPVSGKRVFILDILLFSLLAILFYLYIFQLRQVKKTNKWVVHTHEVINKAERIQALVSEANVIELKYPLRDKDKEQIAGNIKSEVSREFKKLEELTKNDSVHQRINILKTLLSQHAVLSSNQDISTASYNEEKTGAQLRQQLESFKLMEYELLRNTQLQNAVHSKSLGVIRIALSMFLLLLVAGLYFLYRKMNFRALLNSEMKQKNILLDSISDAVIITDGSLKITGFNKRAKDELGWKEEEVIGMHGRDYFNDLTQEEVKEIWQSFITNGQWVGEKKLTRNNIEKYYQVTVNTVKNAKGYITGTVCLVRDITAQKRQVQQLLQRTESLELQLASRIEEANFATQKEADAFIVLDKNFRHVQVNDTIAGYVPLPKSEVIGKTLEEVFPDYINTPIHNAIRESMETGLSKVMTIKSKLTDKWLECNIQPIDEGMVIYFKDVTGVKSAQQEIKHLSQQLQKTRDEDRSRIAYELHEDLGQQLTSIKVALSYLSSKINFNTGADAKQFKQLPADLEKAINSIRKIAFELKPGALEESGLTDAINLYTKQFEEATGIKVKMENDIEGLMIDNDTSVHLYRILQEAFTNIARHSKATEAQLQLTLEEDKIVMRICDNGEGFDAKVINTKSMGLGGMQERARIINATCSIKSKPGNGTTVEVSIPLFASEEDE